MKPISLLTFHGIALGIPFSAQAVSVSCLKTDPSKTFSDGIPMCPNEIRTVSVWSVLQYAYGKSTQLKVVKNVDISNLAALFDQLQAHVDTSRTIPDFATNPVAKNASMILAKADSVGLQVCRSVDVSKNDSFLLFYTKPGVIDNTGGFFGIREVKSSRIVVLLPHDDSDGYFYEYAWPSRKFNIPILCRGGTTQFFQGIQYRSFGSAPNLKRKSFGVYYAVRTEVPYNSDRYIQSELPASRHINGLLILAIVKILEMASPDNPEVPRFPFVWSKSGEIN